VKTRIHNMLEVRLLYKQIENYNKLLEQTVLERTAELRESEARFRRLTELASDWYWEQDENGRFTKLYGPVFEMLGIQGDTLLYETFETSGGAGMKTSARELAANMAARRPFLISSTVVSMPMAPCNICRSAASDVRLHGRFTGLSRDRQGRDRFDADKY